jgi:hypothetical protein
MATITTEMIHHFNGRLQAIDSPWRIVPRNYDGATYSQQTIARAVDPTVAPFLADQLSYNNGTNADQDIVLRVEREVKLQHTFAVTNNLKLGTKGTVEVNAGIAKVNAEVSLEYTRDESTTDTSEETVLLVLEQPVKVPANTRVTMQTLLKLHTVTDLPFELHVVLADGRFAVTPKDVVPLYRYYDGTDHFYTRDGRVPAGHVGEGITCHVSNTPGPGMVRLLRYYDGTDHMYTIDPNELAGNEGWSSEGDEGYVYAGAAPGAIPLYRYYDGVDHFYTTNWNELGPGGPDHVLEGIQAHVVPADITDPALFRSVTELFPNTADRKFVIPGRYRGASTNRQIEVLLKQEPLPPSIRMTEPFLERASEEQLKKTAILGKEESILLVRPGEMVDLTAPAKQKKRAQARPRV